MAKKPIVQGGGENYLGKQPQVVAPRKWQSSPDAPPTELAYITKAEKDLILKKDIHGSLSKGPNMGPSGIMSLDSFGDIGGAGAAGVDTDAGGGYDTGPGGGGFTGQGPNETRQDFANRKDAQIAALQRAEKAQAEALGEKERRNIALATYGPLQKYTGRSRFFGGANKFGYTDTLPDGSLKPGFGGRIFGGLLSLLTGIPFVGGALGYAFDKGKGIFGSKPRDMTDFNRLGLFGIQPGTLDFDPNAPINQELTEAELNAYSRFGNIGAPNKTNTIDGVAPMGVNTEALSAAFAPSNFANISGRFNVEPSVETTNIDKASRNMVDANEMANFFNSQGLMNGGIVDLVDIYD